MTKKKTNYSFQLFARDAKDFAEYPQCGDRTAMSLVFTALGVSREAGRVDGVVASAILDDKIGQQDRRLEPDRRSEIEASIGDLLFWTTRLAHESGLTIEECALAWTKAREQELLNARAFTDPESVANTSARVILERRRRRK